MSQKNSCKVLRIDSSIQNHWYQIVFSNTYDGVICYEAAGEIKTRKQDTNQHGYGLKVVKDLVKKYHGFVDIKYDDRWFTVSINFPISLN